MELLKQPQIDFITIKDKCISPLNPIEERFVKNLIDKLSDIDKYEVIYRGENAMEAYPKLGISINDCQNINDLIIFDDTLFYYGVKSRSYLYNIEDLDFRININDVSDECFSNIFDEYRKVAINGKLISNKDHFLDENKDRFIETILKQEDFYKKRIRNYYLWFLHTLGQLYGNEYKKYSNFLSGTTEYEVANGFATHGRGGNYIGENAIIYCGWICKENSWNLTTNFEQMQQMNEYLLNLQLPVYPNEKYPDEKEISFIGGFVPSFMLFVYHIGLKKILINSKLIEFLNKFEILKNLSDEGIESFMDDILYHGIDINQDDIVGRLKKSIYKSGINHYINGEKEDFEVQ